jgi:hypothetical protein
MQSSRGVNYSLRVSDLELAENASGWWNFVHAGENADRLR